MQALVVDSDEELRETLRTVLEYLGYLVADVREFSAALMLLRSARDPIVALVDLGRPGHQNDAFFAEMASNDPALRRHAYLCLSTAPEKVPADLGAQLATWGVPILGKPFDLDELQTVVAEAAYTLSHTRSS